jgi:hypothetical protein
MTRLTQTPPAAADAGDRRLSAAGEHRKGEFRCVDCGYGVTVWRELPTCPMCGGETWKPVSWRPFARAHETLKAE